MNNSSHDHDFILRLEGVTHFFDQRLVFKNVNLVVEPGSILLVAGPNGAGKTTLMNIMSGLIPPSAGMVEHRASRDKYAFLGHHTFIYNGLSALDNLRFWSGIYGLRLTEHEHLQLLDMVGLKAFAHEKAGNFSRGMSQRLSLARVLMLKPVLFLLDEPATGLDPASRDLLREVISAGAGDGAAIVWVSHTLKEDLDMADRVLLLEGKKQAFYGLARDYRNQLYGTSLEH